MTDGNHPQHSEITDDMWTKVDEMDIKLPDIDGAQIFERVKTIDPDVAVIMMTGHSEEELVRRAISQGAYTCIYKPFDIDRILALVSEISRQRSN